MLLQTIFEWFFNHQPGFRKTFINYISIFWSNISPYEWQLNDGSMTIQHQPTSHATPVRGPCGRCCGSGFSSPTGRYTCHPTSRNSSGFSPDFWCSFLLRKWCKSKQRCGFQWSFQQNADFTWFHMISHDLTCGFKKRWPEKKHKTSGFDPHTFLGSKPKIGILNFHQDGIMLYWDS